MEQKQREHEEYIARKSAEIVELQKEHEELKTRLQELQIKTEENKIQDLKTEIADMKKMIMGNQKSAEKSIAALGEQMLTTNDFNARISNVQDNFDTKLIYISTKLENLERTLMNMLERKEDGKPTILVLGGYNSNKMHLLNRDRTQWSSLSLKLPTTLYCGGAVYLNGEINIFGGEELKTKTFKLNGEMKWIQLADMNKERRNISNSSVAFDGCIWVFGGWNGSESHLNSVEKYIPDQNKWMQMPPMKEKRRYATAAACKGKLFVSGGYNNDNTLRSTECFDPASQKWTVFLDLPSPTWGHAMISDGICLTILGEDEEKKSVWKINPNEEKAAWKKLPQMRESRWNFTANLLGDNIFAIGGEKSKKVEFFNGETWKDGPESPEKITGVCSIVIPAHLAAALSSRQ